MVDYENLPDIAGLDGLLSIFPTANPPSRRDRYALRQFHQHYWEITSYDVETISPCNILLDMAFETSQHRFVSAIMMNRMYNAW